MESFTAETIMGKKSAGNLKNFKPLKTKGKFVNKPPHSLGPQQMEISNPNSKPCSNAFVYELGKKAYNLAEAHLIVIAPVNQQDKLNLQHLAALDSSYTKFSKGIKKGCRVMPFSLQCGNIVVGFPSQPAKNHFKLFSESFNQFEDGTEISYQGLEYLDASRGWVWLVRIPQVLPPPEEFGRIEKRLLNQNPALNINTWIVEDCRPLFYDAFEISFRIPLHSILPLALYDFRLCFNLHTIKVFLGRRH